MIESMVLVVLVNQRIGVNCADRTQDATDIVHRGTRMNVLHDLKTYTENEAWAVLATSAP
jgi:hypothetical protein